MKIEYLASSRLPSTAANAVQVMRMCQAWGRLGHRVTLHVGCSEEPTSSSDPYAFYGVDPVFALVSHQERGSVLGRLRARLPWVKLGPLPRIATGAAIARAWSVAPDLLYARHVWWLVGAHLHRPDVPFALELHAPPANTQTRMAVGWLLRRPACRGVVLISRALELEIGRLYPHSRRHVAPDGADDPAQSLPIERRSASHDLTVGYVGHLYPGKGGELIVQLASLCPRIRFELVGGTDSDIGRLAGSVPVRENLHFAGHKPPSQLADYYRRFDVLLAPYERRVAVHGGGGDVARWMSPLKVFEYMSWGKPILASDLPVLREVLENERTAILLEPSDVGAWRSALEGLARDPARRERLGCSAREAFLARHTWSARASSLVSQLLGASA